MTKWKATELKYKTNPSVLPCDWKFDFGVEVQVMVLMMKSWSWNWTRRSSRQDNADSVQKGKQSWKNHVFVPLRGTKTTSYLIFETVEGDSPGAAKVHPVVIRSQVHEHGVDLTLDGFSIVPGDDQMSRRSYDDHVAVDGESSDELAGRVGGSLDENPKEVVPVLIHVLEAASGSLRMKQSKKTSLAVTAEFYNGGSSDKMRRWWRSNGGGDGIGISSCLIWNQQ
jgi:hypothetical protein